MDYYCPITIISSGIPDTYPAKKSTAAGVDLDGYSDIDLSFIEGNDAVINPTDDFVKMSEEVAKKAPTTTPRTRRSSTKTPVITIDSQPQIQTDQKVPYYQTYSDTTGLLHQAITQADVLSSEIKADLDKIRSSSTVKSKYTYITNLTSAEASLITVKVSAIREINASITKAHELELKRAKDIKDAESAKNDDARMMDMYNAFINAPVGMYQNPYGAPTIPEMMLGTNGMSPTVQGVSIVTGPNGLQPNGDLTPEQIRMRMESNPNIEEVVMYEPSTGRRWFEVRDKTTNAPVPGYPKSDDFLLSDCTLDVRGGIARNRNVNRVWPLVNTEATVIEY